LHNNTIDRNSKLLPNTNDRMTRKFIAPIIHVIKKLISVKLKVSNDEWWWRGSNPENWYAIGLSKGQFAYNTFGKQVAEIQSIENYDVGGPNRLIIVNLKLLSAYNKKTHGYSFNYQTLQIGKPLDLTFGTFNVHGLITHIGDTNMAYDDTDIEVKLLAIYPWEAASYVPGVQMKDSEGNVVGTINQVAVADSSVIEVWDNRGRLVSIPSFNNTRKDVTIKVTLKTYVANNIRYLIDGSAIKIGNHIWLEFEQTALKDAIISKIY